MRTICVFFVVISIVVSASAFGSISESGENAEKDFTALDIEREEYKQIFFDFLSANKVLNFNGITKWLTIDRYEAFLKKYPKSPLADEAKLRIAEFYNVIGQTRKAKKWLDDIIKNHPGSDMETLEAIYADKDSEAIYSGVRLISSGEKTAAWALYYRAIWFPENRKEDLLRMVNDYPESQKAREEAVRELILLMFKK